MTDRDTIGRMRDRVRIERPTDDVDSRGQPTIAWESLGEVWAEVVGLSGREFWAAKTAAVATSHRVRVRYRDDLFREGVRWRLVVTTEGGRLLNIESVVRVADRWLELHCRGEGGSA